MIYDILFAICGIGLIALGLSLEKLDTLVDSWKMETVRLMGRLNDLGNKRFDDSCRLAKAFQRIQELEERLEAQSNELTQHHNKIDTLEINGSIYEGLFEQQGLWGESKEDTNDRD